MWFDVFRIVRSNGPDFTTEIIMVKMDRVYAPNADAATALACANEKYPDRRTRMAVAPCQQ